MHIELRDDEKIQVKRTEDIYTVMKKVLRRQEELNLDREHFWVMGLNIHQWILYLVLVSLGTVDATLVDPMSVFSFALQKSACNIVLIHNHPSGDLIPSDKDMDVTDRMIQVGRILYTPVLDHLVISMRTYLSFLDAGIMEELEESTKWEPSYVTLHLVGGGSRRVRCAASSLATSRYGAVSSLGSCEVSPRFGVHALSCGIWPVQTKISGADERGRRGCAYRRRCRSRDR
jgi:DNA repair protein RadC